MNFAFRQRARSVRLLAERLGENPAALVREAARKDDDALLTDLAACYPDQAVDLPAPGPKRDGNDR